MIGIPVINPDASSQRPLRLIADGGLGLLLCGAGAADAGVPLRRRGQSADCRDRLPLFFYEKGNPDSWSDARLLGEFDTLQLYKNGVPQVKVPLANGDKGPGYELFTSAYPEYGRGGALQLLPTQKGYSVFFDQVNIIPE